MAATALATAPVVARIAAPEADQGVAADTTHVYAIDNNRIGKYRIGDGVRVASWEGDKALFPHINSCTVKGRELVCAASNYPQVPHASSVEYFDTRTLRHLRTHSLGLTDGSLTVMDWHKGSWWAVFAHYDGRGGEPGRDHRYSRLARLDAAFRPLEAYAFPGEVLALMKPHSASGAAWSARGLLAVSGHDRPVIYMLALPDAGTTLRLVATIGVATQGQAIAWDRRHPDRLWSIARRSGEFVASDLSTAR